MANELGLRSVAFEVDDLQATVDQLAADGYSLIGGIGQYERIWSMVYVRGPEGIIVALAQRIRARSTPAPESRRQERRPRLIHPALRRHNPPWRGPDKGDLEAPLTRAILRHVPKKRSVERPLVGDQERW